jgi:pantetheine-phosphate adenylyltransferase
MEKLYKSIGLYFGSFNPLHKGHLHIRDKAREILDEVSLIRIFNSTKRSEYYPASKLIDIQYSSNPIDLINEFEKRYKKVVMIRGIRNEKDYFMEQVFFNQLKLQKSNLKIIYIFSDDGFKNISSSWIKRLTPEDQKNYIM